MAAERKRRFVPLVAWANEHGLNPKTVYGHAEKGHLPLFRLGRRLFVDAEALERLQQLEVERLAARRQGKANRQ